MKRILISCAALVLAAVMLFGCSAYNNPGNYLKIPAAGEVKISQADIDEELADQIADVLEDGRDSIYTEVTDADATVELGDRVNIFYTGTPADSTLELTEEDLAGMTNVGGDAVDLVIGSDSFVGAYESDDHVKDNKGFEEQLIGTKKGDTVTITVTFPDTYSNNTKLEGQVVIFVVTINSISVNVIDDAKAVEIAYDFELVEDEEAEETAETAETEETEESAESGEDTAADTAADFASLFTKGTFEIDYTEDTIEGSFNDVFNIADYSELFKGQKVYGSVTAEATVPEDEEKYSAFAGKKVKITFTVNEITSLPELTDEYVIDYTDEEYTTVDEYKQYLTDSIVADKAFDAILEATVVTEYPKKELIDAYKAQVDSLVYSTLYNNDSTRTSPSDYTPAELRTILTDEVYAGIYAEAIANARESVKERLVVEYLLDYFNITLSNSEYKEKLEEFYNTNYIYLYYYYQITTISQLETYYGKDNLRIQFMSEALNERIAEYVTISD